MWDFNHVEPHINFNPVCCTCALFERFTAAVVWWLFVECRLHARLGCKRQLAARGQHISTALLKGPVNTGVDTERHSAAAAFVDMQATYWFWLWRVSQRWWQWQVGVCPAQLDFGQCGASAPMVAKESQARCAECCRHFCTGSWLLAMLASSVHPIQSIRCTYARSRSKNSCMINVHACRS